MTENVSILGAPAALVAASAETLVGDPQSGGSWSSVMQNAIIVFGAIVGILAGGWLAVLLLHETGAPGTGVTMLLGALPGSVVGGWIGLKLSGERAR